MNSKFSIIKKVLSVATIILLFPNWFSYSASAMGVSAGGFSVSGFATVGADIIPLALIVLLVRAGASEETNKLYLYLSIGGVVITLLTGFLYPVIVKAVKTEGVSQKMTWGLGLWLTLAVYIVLLIISFIDMRQEGSADGKVGSVTDNIQTFAAGVTSTIKDGVAGSVTIECSNCGNKVLKGKKFCGKCGNPMPQDVQVKSNHSVADVNCAKCGSKLPKGSKFCLECGTKVEVQTQQPQQPLKTICPSCGVELPNGAKFCAQCGTKIGG